MSPRAIQLSLAVCLLGLLFLAGSALAQSPPARPPQAAHYRIHMIGNAHIDAPWLWPWGRKRCPSCRARFDGWCSELMRGAGL
jgi:hypothetical protein